MTLCQGLLDGYEKHSYPGHNSPKLNVVDARIISYFIFADPALHPQHSGFAKSGPKMKRNGFVLAVPI
jgi:hypothetical protein